MMSPLEAVTYIKRIPFFLSYYITFHMNWIICIWSTIKFTPCFRCHQFVHFFGFFLQLLSNPCLHVKRCYTVRWLYRTVRQFTNLWRLHILFLCTQYLYWSNYCMFSDYIHFKLLVISVFLSHKQTKHNTCLSFVNLRPQTSHFGILKPFLLLMPISYSKRMKLMVSARDQIIKRRTILPSLHHYQLYCWI